MCNYAQMFDWRNLRYLLVLARAGSLSAAARELAVDHATVGRRIAALEAALGLRLVDRLPRSCPLTEDGAAMAAIAERMEELALEAQRRSRAASSTLSGVVRVSAPPALTTLCVAPRIGALRRAHPALSVVLLGSSSFAALDRGEADIAVRMARPKGKTAVARKIGTMRFGLYAGADYAERPSQSWEFIAFDEALEHVPQQSWLGRVLAGRAIGFRSNDLFGQQAAARAGAGVAVLPTFMGEDDPALIRVPIDPEPPERELWLMAYPDLRRSPAVRAVMNFLSECVDSEPRLRL